MKKVEYRSKTEGPVGLKCGFSCLPKKLVLIDINRYQPGEIITACFLVDLQARKNIGWIHCHSRLPFWTPYDEMQ